MAHLKTFSMPPLGPSLEQKGLEYHASENTFPGSFPWCYEKRLGLANLKAILLVIYGIMISNLIMITALLT